MLQFSADCLSEIFEYLEEDKTLCSCILVNKLWCKISVRILWRRIRNYNTLITCLPNESKEVLSRNGIIISTSTSEHPMFNYASFCKYISIYDVNYNIKRFLYISAQYLLNDNIKVLTNEIFKLLINQIFSLRRLEVNSSSLEQNIVFISQPKARYCLNNLTELYCDSDTTNKFFYQLSQICHNIQILRISIKNFISDGLADLISTQKNLKCLYISQFYVYKKLKIDYNSLTKIPNTLTKLSIHEENYFIPLSFIGKLTNLQELMISISQINSFENFKELEYITFSKLQILEFKYQCPNSELLIKFLENNGRNLNEFYIGRSDDSLNSAIKTFCPNLRKLDTGLTNNDMETLKMFFDNIQCLESIRIYCEGHFNEKNLFEIVVKYSPKNFNELKLIYANNARSQLTPEELESFFVSWAIRISQKSLSLVIIGNEMRTLNLNSENKKIIEKYSKFGIVRKS
ncbi:hypothetical protein C1645_825958 [Glomus cerebriforme]|uniref:F-box domain-containing protein n=1 Tax=Glomus cerebriforme TaxID=658196 RepID=A0A397T0P3_9GLOM|nr:hypothetical protein C1645_825958 [Glomus cerebriforme]